MSFVPDFAPRFGNPLRTYRRIARQPRYRVRVPPVDPNLLSRGVPKVEVMAGRRRVKMNKRKPRRFRRGRLKRRIPRALTSRTKLVTVKAVNYANLAGTGTLVSTNTQLNSVDDVFGTTDTGQPLGYDQWKALYKRAIVIGSKIVVKFHNRGTSAAMVGVWPSPLNQSTTALTNYEYYMETAGCKARLLSPEMDHTVVYHKVSTKRHLQVKDLRDNQRLSIDLVNETAPTDICWWHVFAQVVDQSAAYAVDAVITMSYVVLLVDPIIPARSVET